MKVLALEFYKNGEMKEGFAFGGSLEKEKINPEKTYPSSLQNYLIDTGKEVILVDTRSIASFMVSITASPANGAEYEFIQKEAINIKINFLFIFIQI